MKSNVKKNVYFSSFFFSQNENSFKINGQYVGIEEVGQLQKKISVDINKMIEI